MRVIERIPVSLAATTGDVAATYSPNLTGAVVGIHITYVGATGTGFATTAAIVVTSETTGQTIWSETLTTLATTTVHINRITRQAGRTTAGVALTATESLVREPIYVANERIIVSATAVGTGSRAATVNILMG